MNILFVDDEIDVIEGMTFGMDFASLGIKNVFTCTSAAQAREILLNEGIDILVTDIEMPKESGLDLLKWVRDSGMNIITMFCTGYADFNYAQKAVEMQSFGYFLKPITTASLREHLVAAVRKVEENRNQKKYGQYWFSSQGEKRYNFWEDVTNGSLRGEEEILRHQEAIGLPYSENDRFVITLFFLWDKEERLPDWKSAAFKNMCGDVFTTGGIPPEAPRLLEPGIWCIIYRQGPAFREERFRGLCSQLISHVMKHTESSLNCYYLTGCPLGQVRARFLQLLDVFHDDVLSENMVCDAKSYRKQEFPYSLPQLQDWELLLAVGKEQELVGEINSYLDKLAARREINMPYVKALRIQIMQMIHTVLNQRQISACNVFSDKRFDFLRESSLLSLFHMRRYLTYIVCTASRYLSSTLESQSVVGRVKEYVHTHLSENITRTSMAKIVFLNSDYLARLFKKETGVSLGTYLQNCRIHEAKKLLIQTGVPVNEIAQQVGYDNFSYFSHIFREKTGMTPNEYRKTNAEG